MTNPCNIVGDFNCDSNVTGADVVYLESYFISGLSNEFPLPDNAIQYINSDFSFNENNVSFMQLFPHVIASFPEAIIEFNNIIVLEPEPEPETQ